MTHSNRALLGGALLVTALGGLALDGTPASADRRYGKGGGGYYGRDVVVVREPYYPARRYRDCDDYVVREYVQPRYVRVVHPRDCGCRECVLVVQRSHRHDRYCGHW